MDGKTVSEDATGTGTATATVTDTGDQSGCLLGRNRPRASGHCTNGRRTNGFWGSESGEAVAGFALTAGLTTLIFLIVMQFGYFLYTKAVIIDAAGQGARVAARHLGTIDQGITRTNELLGSIAGTPKVMASRKQIGASHSIEITVTAQLPLLGPYGIPGLLEAKGNALVEQYQSAP